MAKVKVVDNKQRLETTEVKLKSLIKNKVKDDIWTLAGESIINVKYHIFEDKIVREPKRSITYQSKLSLQDNSLKMRIDNILPKEVIKSPEKPNNPKKLSFVVPDSFKERDKKRLLTSKNLFQMDMLRSAILGKKESLKNESTMPTSLNNSLLHFTRLDYDTIDLEEGEVFEADTFADVFFICGLPKKGAKVITDSHTLEAPCKHKDCGILRSYKPDILSKYPQINYKSLSLCSSVIFY